MSYISCVNNLIENNLFFLYFIDILYFILYIYSIYIYFTKESREKYKTEIKISQLQMIKIFLYQYISIYV